LALAGPVPAQIVCFLAGIFHFLVFWHFGLNWFELVFLGLDDLFASGY